MRYVFFMLKIIKNRTALISQSKIKKIRAIARFGLKLNYVRISGSDSSWLHTAKQTSHKDVRKHPMKKPIESA